MIHQPILVNGEWREASFPVSSFKAVSPLTARQLPDSFPVSSFLDIDEMLQADSSERDLIDRLPFQKRADLLNLIADKIEQNKEEICQTAHTETGFAIDTRLEKTELPEMLQQLREGAQYCLNRTWREATIDTRKNIRSIREALHGPVLIFGPASMPLSRNSCGGMDFACAIASGNSVVSKSNPAHPLTCLKLAQIIHAALQELKLPRTLFQFFYNTTQDLGYRLVSHPMIGALAFTGSHKAGMLLKESTDHSGTLAFFNMTGINPVFWLPESVNEFRVELGKELCHAVMSDGGQSCSKPGVVFLLETKESSNLIKNITDEFNANQCKPLLTEDVARNLDLLVTTFTRLGARKLTRKEFYQPNPFVYPNTVLHIDIKTWLKCSTQFQQEAFGPLVIFVTLENETQFAAVVKTLENSMNTTIYAHEAGNDDQLYNMLEPALRRKSGKLINNHMPTERAQSQATVSGGPFPASVHPGFTATGMPAAIKRFTVLRCYDGVKHDRLPEDLQSQSPGGFMLRLIDDKYTE